MKKSKLTGFISKYSLGGNTETTKLVVKDNELSTSFITIDQNVIGSVTLKGFEVQDAELGIHSTKQLNTILGAIDEDMNVVLNSQGGNIYSISCTDATKEVTFMLCDLSIIRPVPTPKTMPPFELKLNLTPEFTNTYMKAFKAIPESTNFGITSSAGDVTVYINYSSINTNRVSFNAEAVETQDIPTVCFSAKLFSAILSANSDSEGVLEVSSKGLARLTFSNEDYTATYYLVKLTIA